MPVSEHGMEHEQGESTMWTFFVHIFSLAFGAFPNVGSYPGRYPT